MSRVETFRNAARAAAGKAKVIADHATKEGRPFTDTEQAEFDQHLGKARELVDAMKAAQRDDQVLADAKALADEIGVPTAGAGYTGVGSAPGGLPDVKAGRHVTGREWAGKAAQKIQATARDYGVKALVSGSIDVPNVVQPGIVPLPAAPQRLIDVIVNRQPLGGNEFSYLRQVVRTNNAAVVADGGTKPTSVSTWQNIEDRARVIAHLSEAIPERYFADHAGLIQVLEAEMFNGVADALEAQVIAGSGTGENMTGVTVVSGTVQVAYTTSVLATCRRALTTLRNLGEVPNAWVFNPTNAEAIDLVADGSGRFQDAEAVDRILGRLPRLVSTGVPAGVAVLADWNQCAVYVREDLRLDADRSGTLFDKNQVKLRAEGRFGFAVHRPQAFGVVDLTP